MAYLEPVIVKFRSLSPRTQVYQAPRGQRPVKIKLDLIKCTLDLSSYVYDQEKQDQSVKFTFPGIKFPLCVHSELGSILILDIST